MELRTLRYFDALAAELHFTRAAARCNISQSTLSHQMKQLEADLGASLFDRTRKRPTLTIAGEAFHEHVAVALDQVDRAIQAVRSVEVPTGRLRIGVWTNFLMLHVLPRCMRAAAERGILLDVRLREIAGERLTTALSAGEIDLAIASEISDTEGFNVAPLFTERLQLGVPPGHRFARRREVRPVELQGESLALLSRRFATRLVVDAYLAEAGVAPSVAVELSSIELLAPVALQAKLPIIAPSNMLRQMADFTAVPLVDPVPSRPMVMLSRPDFTLSSEVEQFIGLIKEAC